MNTIDYVRKFHEKFGHKISDKPNSGSRNERELRIKLIAEELGELCESLGINLFMQSVKNKTTIHVYSDDFSEINLVEVADALGDLDYVIQGTNLVFGMPSKEIIEEIHRSNMSKLGEDGNPIFREDGKILKGENYFPPNLRNILFGKSNEPIKTQD